jgi:ABC-2 type transport system ATP-binding protein
MNLLEISHLSKKYRDFTLSDLNIRLESGYIMGFIGPNGAGKTTTIKLIMNLIRREAGEIRVFGLDNINDEVAVKDRIGFVFEENHCYNELTLRQMGGIVAPFYSQWDSPVFNGSLERFELPCRKKIKDLSRGMKIKFSLAVALSHHAELIIMDEPTSGLDPIFRAEVLEILSEVIQDERTGVFFSTHITTDLEKVADYITFINQGQIVFSEAKDDLLERYAIVKGERGLLDAELKREFVGVKEHSFGFEGMTADADRVRHILGNSVLIERPTLEEIMLYTVRGNLHV